MKRIERASELLWLFGVVFVALGVAVCSKANLGVSMIAAPAFIVSEALLSFWSGFSVGVTEYILQGVLLIILCVIVRRLNWRYLLAFAVAVIYGYTLDLFICLLGGITLDGVASRWIMLIIGDIITSFGVACFFRTYLPLAVYELFVAETARVFNKASAKVKWAFDATLLVVSIVLAVVLFGDISEFDWATAGYANFHSIGLGTLVTTAINSPLIMLSGKLVDKFFGTDYRFKKLNKYLRIS